LTVNQNQSDIVEIPLDGSAIHDLLATSQNEFWPAWAPDGSQFAYITDRTGQHEIWLKSMQQGWERLVVTSKDFPDHANDFDNLHFSPDGQRIAYQNGFGGQYSIWISNLAGGAPFKLAPADYYQDAPVWSPDAQWIAYVNRNGN